ncbi:MAG: HemK family protein methyltransferase [Candidatus Sungbacteria bacterium]|nr:HemK family protein methyltransferase [Candidatus Sungbacteria bacterium]
METQSPELKRNTAWLLRDKYPGHFTGNFFYDMCRIKMGEPIDYVIGWIPFLGCRIDLSLKPFIPRSETEYWVKQAIDGINLRFGGKPLRMLDIFAGSGCIGIAALKHLSNIWLDFVEKNEQYIPQIQKNLVLNHIDSTRTNVIQSDIFENIHGNYDVIFANPPYVPLARRSTVAHSVCEYEPLTAVFGGTDGLDVIRRFLREARLYLNPEGIIWMEFDSPEKDKINQLVEESGYSRCEFLRDQFGEWRTLKIVV